MSLTNPWREFAALNPPAPLLVGTVAAISGGVATVTLPGGGVLRARGTATVGLRVYVRDGLIEGPAPTLTYVMGEA